MANPKVSFVTGVKNRSEDFKEMLKSLKRQDIAEWEAIIVDDHSSENIEQIVNETNDPRIIYFKLPQGKSGISEARNFAIKQANSDFILVADSDDINEPFRARITYNIMTRKKCDVLYANIRMCIPGQRKRAKRFQPFNENALRMFNYIPNPAAAFRKDKFIKVGGYDPDFIVSEDYELWIRLLNANAKFCYTRQVLVNYNLSPKGISIKRFSLMHQSLQKVREKNNIEPFDIREVKNFAKPGIVKSVLSANGLKLWGDDRYQIKVTSNN